VEKNGTVTPRAVVFAYHDVGDRCLRALASSNWDVPLVVTHEADPKENSWFASVAETARDIGIPVLTPTTAKEPGLERTLGQLRPDFIFSFYYRHLLGPGLLRQARRAALNMHGSLLPRYRGRAPVNWAILNGEQETGATLHHMVARADAGDIVDQMAVPILEDDDARTVMAKVALAAEIVLVRSLPALAAGTAERRAQNLDVGEYCRGRTPEDGRINWSASARQIHDLVRAVAPPYPGAFADLQGHRWWFHRTRRRRSAPVPDRRRPGIYADDGTCVLFCADGGTLELRSVATQEGPMDLRQLARELAERPLFLN
jgi:methionyl-tRNA formyltransferase